MRAIPSLKQLAVVFCLLLTLLTACGQRGPLFLPDKNTTSTPAQKPQPADDQETQPAASENDKGH